MLSYRSTQRLQGSLQWVAHSQAVLQRLTAVSGDLQGAETKERDYELTAQWKYLDACRLDAQDLPVRLQELHLLTQDNVTLQRCLNQLAPLITAQQAELRRAHTLDQQGRRADAMRVLRAPQGQGRSDRTRALVQAMRVEERRLLRARQRDAEQTGTLSQALVSASATTVLLLVGLMLVLARGDIRERKRAAAALAEREEQFRAVVEQAMDGVFFFDPDSKRLLDANEAFRQMLGYTEAELAALTLYDILAHDKESVDANIAVSLQDGRRVIGERRYRRKDGATLPVNVSIKLLRWGEKEALCVVVHDLTERSQAETVLRSSEALFRSALLSMEEGLVLQDREGVIRLCNDSAARILGLELDDLIHRPVTELGFRSVREDGTDFPRAGHPSRIALATGRPQYEVTVGFLRPGIEQVQWLLFGAVPLWRDGEEQPWAAVVTFSDITDRKRAMDAQHKQQEFLNALLDNMQEGIAACDASGRLTLFNRATREFHGLPAEPLPPGQWAQHFDLYEADGETPMRTEEVPLFRAFAGETVRSAEMVIAPKDGAARTLLANGQAIHDAQGAKLGAVVVMHDVTAQRRAEEALLESRRFIESITEHSTSIIFVFDLDTMTNIYSNRNVGEFLGYSVEQIRALGEGLLPAMIHPDDLPLVLNHFGRFADTQDGEVVELEYRARHADGEWRWVWNREVVFNRHADGRARQILGTVQDITERRKAEDTLRRSETRLSEAQRVAQIGSWEYDRATGGLFWSEELFRLFGLDSAGGAPSVDALMQRYHPDDVAMHMEISNRAMQDGLPYEFDIRILRADGVVRWAHAVGRGRRDEAGVVIGLFGTLMDIHERKQAEETVRRNEERLRLLQDVTSARGVPFDAKIGRLLHLGCELFGLEIGALTRIHDERYEITHAVSPGGAIPAGFTCDTSDTFCAEVARTQHLLSNGDIGGSDWRQWPAYGAFGLEAYLGAPLWVRDRVYGTFCFSSKSPRPAPFTSSDEELLRLMAQWIGGELERREAEEAVRQADQKYRLIYENAVEGIFQTSPDGRLLSANPAMARMHGFDSPAQMIGRITDIGRQLYTRPADRRRMLDLMAEHGHVSAFEAPMRRRDGSVIWISMNARAVYDDGGAIRWLEGTAEDITERQEAEQRMRDYSVVLEFQKAELEKANAELEALATQDGLTGLKNHRALQERLAEEWGRASRYGTPLSLLLLDVDFFKQYNDAFGHPAGDEVLKQVSRRLEGAARETDFAARYGGEEFAVLLPHTDHEGAMRLAERVRAAVAAGIWPLRPVTVSVGVATIRPDMPDAAALVTGADRALYRSKADGRDRVTHDSPDWVDVSAQPQTA